MTELAAQNSAPSGEPALEKFYYARVGTFALTGTVERQQEIGKPSNVLDDLRKNLESDSRVIKVGEAGGESSRRAWWDRFFPPYIHPDHDTLATGADSLRSIFFLPALLIEINVPKKNQPKPQEFRGVDLPSERYWASWDGMTAIVCWSEQRDYHPVSGGQVIESVLRDAAHSVGLEIVTQSCNENCTSLFVHSLIKLRLGEGRPSVKRSDYYEYVVELPTLQNERQAVEALGRAMTLPGRNFARMKNVGIRLITIEDAAREELDAATTSQYTLSKPRSTKPVGWLKEVRPRRAARVEVRTTTAAASHFISVLEMLRRQWEDHRTSFDHYTKDFGDIFADDQADDLQKITSLDLERLENRTSHVSEVLNNWSVIQVTLWGAVSGGFAGGILGAVATLLAG